LTVAPWGVTVAPGDGSDLGRALTALVGDLPRQAPTPDATGTVRATVYLPGGGGLGSSAALGVAVARTLAPVLVGRDLSFTETLEAALAWERVFHGNPSGVDHTMATQGGAAVYSRREGLNPVPITEPLRLLVADTGERTPTRAMIDSVARLYARRPE